MKIETKMGDFELEPLKHGDKNDCIRKALCIQKVRDENGHLVDADVVDGVLETGNSGVTSFCRASASVPRYLGEQLAQTAAFFVQ